MRFRRFFFPGGQKRLRQNAEIIADIFRCGEESGAFHTVSFALSGQKIPEFRHFCELCPRITLSDNEWRNMTAGFTEWIAFLNLICYNIDNL